MPVIMTRAAIPVPMLEPMMVPVLRLARELRAALCKTKDGEDERRMTDVS
jgi:hypothetical protein